MNEKLPLWRLIAAIAAVAAMLGVLLTLAPLYFEDYQLRQYIHSAIRQSPSSDDALRTSVVNRARQLDLPLQASEIEVTHDGAKVRVHLKYAVQMDFPLYQVDVHLPLVQP